MRAVISNMAPQNICEVTTMMEVCTTSIIEVEE
jgi:hypothetical protein